MSKPRVVKDYNKLDESVKEQIKLNYPNGFDRQLIIFKNIKKKFVSALPFEASDRFYLVRMTKEAAREIVRKDDDYDDDGHLKESVKADYTKKYNGDEIEETTEEVDDI